MKYEITLPEWATQANKTLPESIPTIEQRMAVVIQFSRLNFENRTGGPFAAGIFERKSGRPIVIGVNRVIPCSNSSAHAEIVAISMAQMLLNTFDLGGDGMPDYQLVVNARPCAMCFGSIPWSGVRSVAVAAPGDQIEKLTGFDEGPIHPEWQHELRRRGIEVIVGVMSKEACDVLRAFGESDQLVYNGRLGEQNKNPD